MKFGKAIRDENRVESLREKINDRCAKKREAICIDAIIKLRLGSAQRDNNLQFVAVALLDGRGKSGQLEEKKALRTSKVLF